MKEVVIILVLGVSLAYMWFIVKPKDKDLMVVSTNPNAEVVKPTSATDKNTYSSKSLGINFKYDSSNTGVEEKGDKIYVYRGKKDLDNAQYVEVFSKDPKLTLQEAIKNKFLKKYSEKNCYPQTVSRDKVSGNFEGAIIAFPVSNSQNNNAGPWWQNADKCPKTYTETNGAAYFVMDKKHPDKFLFLNIGQYGIPVNGKNWQDTIGFN